MLYLLFSFRGRINRSRYWFGLLLVTFGNVFGQILVQILSASSAAAATTLAGKLEAYGSAAALLLPLSIASFWASLAVQWKRFHDRGRPGWLSLAPLIVMGMLIANVVGDIMAGADVVQVFTNILPYFWTLMLMGLAMFIDLGCMPSAEGPNKYDDGPSSPGAGAHQPVPGAPNGGLVNAQAAMERAIAQRDAGPATTGKPPRSASMPPMGAPATAGPRAFGRRSSR